MNDKEIEIHVKGGFSERKGIKKFSEIVQINSLNERTRNKLYNQIYRLLTDEDSNFKANIVKYIYIEVFSLSIDEIPVDEFGFLGNWEEVFDVIKDIFTNNEYNEIFDFIEGVINGIDYCQYYHYKKEYFIKDINKVFFEENVNYRVIDDIITDIVDEEQINSIQDTLNNPYEVVSEHYSKAIEQLYSVKDYANSIKESISAVEAMCQVINGSKEELNKALKNLKITIHPALEQAYIKLYAYTCDENGSRHANGIGEKNATFEEAKYMLISCSAFVNYLKENFKEGK